MASLGRTLFQYCFLFSLGYFFALHNIFLLLAVHAISASSFLLHSPVHQTKTKSRSPLVFLFNLRMKSKSNYSDRNFVFQFFTVHACVRTRFDIFMYFHTDIDIDRCVCVSLLYHWSFMLFSLPDIQYIFPFRKVYFRV